jgi:hypothetical protein
MRGYKNGILPSNVSETGMSFAWSLWASGEYGASQSIAVELFLPRFDSERTQVALSRRQLVQGILLCTTSQRTFRLRHTRQALGARRFTGADMSDAFLLADSPSPEALAAGGEGILEGIECVEIYGIGFEKEREK